MKVAAKVLQTQVMDDGRYLATLQFNGKLPPIGESLTIKWGKGRTLAQNKRMWKYFTFVLDNCGLKDEYLTTYDLHETLKKRLLCRKVMSKGGFYIMEIGSTTEFTTDEMNDYILKCDKVLTEYHHINTSQFFVDDDGEG